jgi:hypothetical protein
MPPTIAPLMHPLASAAAVNTRSEVAITAHAKIFFIGSFLPHMTKRLVKHRGEAKVPGACCAGSLLGKDRDAR